MTGTSAEPVRFMQQLISLDYREVRPQVSWEFGRALVDGRIIGHRCPSCSLVFVPPKGFCPICVVPTGADDVVEVSDHGSVTSWTVLTPIQYHGQQEREDYALASILLDGASGTIGQQRLVEVPLDDIEVGLRIQAVWADPADRKDDAQARGWGFGSSILGWRPSGEPTVDAASLERHAI